MNNIELYQAIGEIDNDIIEKAVNGKLKKRNYWSNLLYNKKVLAVACSLVLVAIIALVPVLRAINGVSVYALAKVEYPMAYGYYDNEARKEVFDTHPVSEVFIDGLNDFSYLTASRILNECQGNINYSPLSLYYGLSIATSGANGDTQDELLELLHVADLTTLTAQSHNLYNRLYKDNNIGHLKIANSIWSDSNFANFHQEFADSVAKTYYAESYNMNFDDARTTKAMSDWIRENTSGQISPDVSLDPHEIMRIINTVSFGDDWVHRFSRSDNKNDLFYLSNGDTVDVEYMTQRQNGSFAVGNGYTKATRSLKNQGKMVFVLPDVGTDPQDLFASEQGVKELFEGGENLHGKITWELPKFDFASNLQLEDIIKELGVERAFAEDANFTNITDGTMYISSIEQGTKISIDEQGVKAAGFTSLPLAGDSLPQHHIDMILDRPFIFAIQAVDGTILFVGIVENPTLS